MPVQARPRAGGCDGAGDELHQSGSFAAVSTPAERFVIFCSGRRQRADDLDAGDRGGALADLLHAYLGLAARHHLPHRRPRIRVTIFDFISSAMPNVRTAWKSHPAHAGPGMGDGTSAAMSARLSASGCRALGPPCGEQPMPGAGEIDTAAGNDLAVLDQAIDRLGGQRRGRRRRRFRAPSGSPSPRRSRTSGHVRSKSGARSSITGSGRWRHSHALPFAFPRHPAGCSHCGGRSR